MKKRKLVVLGGCICLILILAVLPFMAACAKPAPAPEAPETIKIGAALPLTGNFATGGQEMKEGYEIAVEDINDAGGVYVKEFGKKIPLELIMYDCESDPVKVVSKYETLHSSDRVVACLGSFASALHAAAAAIADKNKVPYVAVGFSLWDIHKHGYKFLFSPFTKSPDYAQMLFDFLDDMLRPEERPKKIAIWELQTDWGIEFAQMVADEANGRGYEVVDQPKYTMGTQDFSPMVMKAKSAGAEMVVSNPITPSGIVMVKQMKELNYNPKLFWTLRAGDTEAWAGALGADGDYMTIGGQWNYRVKWSRSQHFVETCQEKYGHLPGSIGGPAYACVEILADAIGRAGTLDSLAIREALLDTDLMTCAGQVQFREDGTMIDPPPMFQQWLKGEREIIWPKELATAEFVYPIPKWSDR